MEPQPGVEEEEFAAFRRRLQELAHLADWAVATPPAHIRQTRATRTPNRVDAGRSSAADVFGGGVRTVESAAPAPSRSVIDPDDWLKQAIMTYHARGATPQYATRGAKAAARLRRCTAPQPLQRLATDDYRNGILCAAGIFVPCPGMDHPTTEGDLFRRIEEGLNGNLPRERVTSAGRLAHERIGPNRIILGKERRDVIKSVNGNVAALAGLRPATDPGNVIVAGPAGVGKSSLYVTYAAAVAEATGSVIGLYFDLGSATVIPSSPETLIALALLVGARAWLTDDDTARLQRLVQILECRALAAEDSETQWHLGEWLADKGLGLFLAIDEADLLYHKELDEGTFSKWHSFLCCNAEAPQVMPMSWALTGSGARLRSYTRCSPPQIAPTGGRYFLHRRTLVTTEAESSGKTSVRVLSTETSFEEFRDAVVTLSGVLPPRGPVDRNGSNETGKALEKLGRVPLSSPEIRVLLRNPYATSLVYKRCYGNPRTLVGLLEGRDERALEPPDPDVAEAVRCIAGWHHLNRREKVIEVIKDPFSFRREDFTLTGDQIVQENYERRRLGGGFGATNAANLGSRCRSHEDFYDLCESGHMEPFREYGTGAGEYVVELAITSASVLFKALVDVVMAEGLSSDDAQLLDGMRL